MSDNKSITAKVIAQESQLPALRYIVPRVAAFYAMAGVNVGTGMTSVGTRLLQTPYPMFTADGVPELHGQKGTPGATGLWQALLGLRASDLSDSAREDELLSLLIARSAPSERIFMACHCLAGLSVAERDKACVKTFGGESGKAYSKMVAAIDNFLMSASEIVKADIKKKPGTTHNLSAHASTALQDARVASAKEYLALLTPDPVGK